MTKEDYEEKISLINKDLDRLRKEAGNERQISALVEYRAYLQDELNQLNENGS